jgi:AcrR family transcriptional regulator
MTKPSTTAAPRRGRPSLARASAIDKILLNVAYELFLEHGYDPVTMEQIAAAAQVAKGTLYVRYSSKEVLFTAMIDAAIQRWSSEAALRDDLLTDDIEQRLRHHARTIVTYMHNPEVMAMQRLLLAVSSRFPELASAMHDRGYRYIVDLLTKDMMEAQERAGKVAQNPETVAQLIVSGLAGYQLQHFCEGQPPAAAMSFAERLVDLVIAGRSAW